MMKRILKVVIVLVLLLTIAGSSILLVACKDPANNNGGNKGNGKYYDNQTDALRFSTQDVDGVFNPFFSTSGPDSNIVGMTQLGMISSDGNGKPVVGEGEACIVLDYETIYDKKKDTTTYYFVLKNNVKFSNGSPLTMKDVLFNLYVYLDQAYTGSATIYSTKIIGLQEYRTQQASEDEQKNFEKSFQIAARARIDALDAAFQAIKKEEGSNFVNNDAETFRDKLVNYTAGNPDSKVVEDYDRACKLFREELEQDYKNCKDTYEDIIFTDQKGENHKNLFTTDVEAFLYNEGFYKWDKKNAKLTSSLVNDDALDSIKTWSEEDAIDTVYESKMPTALDEIITYWATAGELFDYITKEGMQQYFDTLGDTGYQNISGIKFANKDNPVYVKGVEYAVPTYERENYGGAVTSGNEVLSIEIEKVDPKAIWNFSFAVAPMYYYSNAEEIAKFDYVSHFGVKRGNQDFMNNVVKDPDKIGLPVGAGPYVAAKSTGGTDNVRPGDFKANNVIYFEANPNYLMGEPLIKKIRYQVISSNGTLNALYSDQIDFAEPNAKPETISELNKKKSEGIANQNITTLGYGYIGINAGKVPSLAVRQAIMHSINTQLCIDYYKTTAQPIYRSMSKESWAYPKGCTPYYPYIGDPIPEDLDVVNPAYKDYVESLGKSAGDRFTLEEQQNFIIGLVEGADYRLNASGVYQKGTSDVLKYTFTIAGQETDHPAYTALLQAGTFLNKIGFEIITTPDSQALNKLASGSLTVWAAAWGSTLDPDMYQVYHKDSKATSVLNWGYKQILANVGGKYDTEYQMVQDLSELIDQAREIEDQKTRAEIYSKALDKVMELAVELPTYQRDDLFAYNYWKIDESTFNQNPSSFKGLTSDIHLLSLIVER